MERTQAHMDVQLEDDHVKVTRWTFPPGSETGHHRHGYDYVVVPVTSGMLTIESGSETSTAALAAGVSYNRSVGVEHNVANDTDAEIVFVEVELLDRAG